MIKRLTEKAGVSYRPEITAGSIIAMASQTVTIIVAIVGALMWINKQFSTLDIALAELKMAKLEIDRRLQTFDVDRARTAADHDAIADIKGDLKWMRAILDKRTEVKPSLATPPGSTTATP